MNCKPIRHNDQMQCHCGLAWDIGEEQPECRNRRSGDRRKAAPVTDQNTEHMRLTASKCFGNERDGHAFFNNTCVHCLVTRPMLLNDDSTRSIFDDVDE